MKYIKAKTILSKVKDDNYFGFSYNMNLYRGCQHACIYCDSRSKCYHMDELHKIYIKENAIALLDNELSRKRHKGTIGFGSMNDPYMPIEKEQGLTRRALELIVNYRYPVHIITKSDLVLRDLDLLKRLKEIYCAVTFTITTADDDLAARIEPHAPSPSNRFKAISKLREAGVYCGITMMPILPFINDSEENVQSMVESARQAGANYILPFFGVSLREGSREYFYKQLDRLFPELKQRYIEEFGNSYACNATNANALYKILKETCQNYGISNKMRFYAAESSTQLAFF